MTRGHGMCFSLRRHKGTNVLGVLKNVSWNDTTGASFIVHEPHRGKGFIVYMKNRVTCSRVIERGNHLRRHLKWSLMSKQDILLRSHDAIAEITNWILESLDLLSGKYSVKRIGIHCLWEWHDIPLKTTKNIKPNTNLNTRRHHKDGYLYHDSQAYSEHWEWANSN